MVGRDGMMVELPGCDCVSKTNSMERGTAQLGRERSLSHGEEPPNGLRFQFGFPPKQSHKRALTPKTEAASHVAWNLV